MDTEYDIYYMKLQNHQTSEDEIIDFFSSDLNIEQLVATQSSFGEQWLLYVIGDFDYPGYGVALFDYVFDIIKTNDALLNVLMYEGDGREHMFNVLLRKVGFHIDDVLDMIEKYWTRDGIRQYSLIYSVETYTEVRNLLYYYADENKLSELREKLLLRHVTEKEFDFNEFQCHTY